MASFDEEHIDPHGECAAEIHRLQTVLRAALKALETANIAGHSLYGAPVTISVRAALAKATPTPDAQGG